MVSVIHRPSVPFNFNWSRRRVTTMRRGSVETLGRHRSRVRARLGAAGALPAPGVECSEEGRRRSIIPSMHPDTKAYNAAQAPEDRKLCDLLAREIDRGLPDADNKIWHGHPVWFLSGNPIVGY